MAHIYGVVLHACCVKECMLRVCANTKMTITTRNKWNAEIASLYTRLHHGAVDDDPIIIDEVDEVDHIEHEYNSLNDGHRDEAEDNTKAK